MAVGSILLGFRPALKTCVLGGKCSFVTEDDENVPVSGHIN
jgi:hypothetical protein